MLTYLLIAGALFFGSIGASYLAMNALAAALIPVPVAVYCARGHIGRALGLVAVAGAAALVMVDSPPLIIYHVLLAMVGIPLGLGISRGWTYSRTVTAMVAVGFGASLAGIVFFWSDWIDASRLLLDSYMTTMREQAAASQAEGAAIFIGYVEWLKAHWAELGLGIGFCSILIQTCITLGLTRNWMRRRFGFDRLAGWFGRLRPSEWLVWAVILVSLLWFLDQARPDLVSRIVVWNAAVALAGIYWLSGLSILLYAMETLRPHIFVYFAFLMLLMMSVWIHPVLLAIGLFDTWGDFRRNIDRMAAARKKRREEMERSDDVE
jgi:hypothetical protein